VNNVTIRQAHGFGYFALVENQIRLIVGQGFKKKSNLSAWLITLCMQYQINKKQKM